MLEVMLEMFSIVNPLRQLVVTNCNHMATMDAKCIYRGPGAAVDQLVTAPLPSSSTRARFGQHGERVSGVVPAPTNQTLLSDQQCASPAVGPAKFVSSSGGHKETERNRAVQL